MWLGATNRSISPPSNPTAPPQAIWPGWLDSFSHRFAWWPPVTGNPDSYNVYRQDVGLIATNVPNITLTPVLQYGFTDYNGLVFNGRTLTLNAGQTYTWWVTAVTGGVESLPSATLTRTMLSNSPGSTLPTDPVDPATYLPTYSLPNQATVTTWLASANTSSLAAGTGTPGPGNTVTGCGIQYALNNATSGDLIVLTAGLTYTGSVGGSEGYLVPSSLTGPATTYIISSEDPVYKAGGKLPAYVAGRSVNYITQTMTGLPAAGATSATLTAAWTGRTGYYTTNFYTTAVPKFESRSVHYVNGSTAISWSAPLSIISDGGQSTGKKFAYNELLGTCTSTTIIVHPGDYVTPDDSAAMPILQFGVASDGGVGMIIQGNNIRVVGVWLQPTGATPSSPSQTCLTLAGNNNMMDRCIMGSDSTLSSWQPIVRAVTSQGTNNIGHQCYIFGISNAVGFGGTITALGTIVPGSGYTPTTGTATYNGVFLSHVSGSGPGVDAQVNVTVTNGSVSAVTLVAGGFKWGAGASLTVTAAQIGGTGSGFQIPVSAATGAGGGGDTQAWFQWQNGPVLVESSYLEATAECVLSGGTSTPQAGVPHDGVYRYNFMCKNGAWSNGVIGWELKNHVELKIGLTYAFHDNIHQNCWNSFAGAGQFGRIYQFGPLDETGQQTTHHVSAATWAGGIASLTATFYNPQIPIGSLFNVTVTGMVPAGYNGSYLATWEGVDGAFSGHFNVPIASNPGTLTTGGSVSTVTMQLNPWTHVNDCNVYNNQAYGCGSFFNPHDDNGVQYAGASSRMRCVNNVMWGNPAGTDNNGTLTGIFMLNGQGHVPDIIYDHNTMVSIPQSQPGAPSGYLPVPASPNAQYTSAIEMFSHLTRTGDAPWLTDRMTVTNNIFDGFVNFGVSAIVGGAPQGTGPTAVPITCNVNTLIWSNNVGLLDAGVYTVYNSPGGVNYANVPYANIFNGFVSNFTMPTSPSAWNAAKAPYTTGDLNGGAVGSTF